MESIVLVGVCITIAIVTGFALYNDSDSVILVVMTIMAVVCLVMPLMDYAAQESKKADVQQCLDKNYSIYMDGRHVKEENIDVFSYKVKIDKKLILSDTNSRQIGGAMRNFVIVVVLIVYLGVLGFTLCNGNVSVTLLIEVVTMAACLVILLISGYKAKESRKASMQHCLDENYSIYMDGRHVKEKDIDVFNYKVKIDKKHKKLILSGTNYR